MSVIVEERLVRQSKTTDLKSQVIFLLIIDIQVQL